MSMVRILTVSRVCSGPILSIKGIAIVDIMLNLDGDGHGDVTCKQTLICYSEAGAALS